MNRKIFVIALVAVLVVSIILGTIVYFQDQSESQQASAYTVIGTLRYQPGPGIFPGVSMNSSNPILSPSPHTVSFSMPDGQGGTYNYTVNAFIHLNFIGKLTLPRDLPGAYPTGFHEWDTVKLSGDIDYNPANQVYTMNVTSIAHQAP
jgi:hypothetical protein